LVTQHISADYAATCRESATHFPIRQRKLAVCSWDGSTRTRNPETHPVKLALTHEEIGQMIGLQERR